MIPYLPRSADMLLPARLAAYAILWSLPVLALNIVLLLVSDTYYNKAGRGSKHRNLPAISLDAVFISIVRGCWVLPLAACQAIHNPTAATWSFKPVAFCLLGFWVQGSLFLFDTWGFFVQRYAAFLYIHRAKSRKCFEDNKVQLHASRTATAPDIREAAAEALISGIPLLTVYCAGWLLGNWWMVLAAVYHTLLNTALTWLGLEARACSWLYLLINPFNIWRLTVCNSTCQTGCALQASLGSSRNSPQGRLPTFFTFWEEYYSTCSSKALPAIPLSILAGNLLYQLCVSLLLQCLLIWPVWTVLCWFWLYVVLPPAATAWVIDKLNVPELVSKRLPLVLEAFRRSYGIAYPIPLTKGAFQALHSPVHGLKHGYCSRNLRRYCSSPGCSVKRSSSSHSTYNALSERLLDRSFTSPGEVTHKSHRDSSYAVTADARAVRDQGVGCVVYGLAAPGRTSSSSSSSSTSGGVSLASSGDVLNIPGDGPAQTLGSTTSSAASSPCSTGSTTRAVSLAESQSQPLQGRSPTAYLFACHPTGRLSRAAFYTFAAKGPGSPVAGLKSRLVVGRQLMLVPLLREFLLAFGCCEASPAAIKRNLQAGTSVAVTPGGWRESRYTNAYNLVLQKRKGFVKLAAETGAALVPVLCLGEHSVTSASRNSSSSDLALTFLTAWRPVHCRVVFGRPIVLLEGESVEQLHARYVDALLMLGREHGVTLNILE